MRKDTNHYETSKIIVDFYHPQKDNSFTCSCFTPGVPASIEPEYLVKTVTYDELKNNIADGNGKVDVSLFHDEVKLITFDKYLSGLSAAHIMTHCADVINKREFRNHLFNPAEHRQSLTHAA